MQDHEGRATLVQGGCQVLLCEFSTRSYVGMYSSNFFSLTENYPHRARSSRVKVDRPRLPQSEEVSAEAYDPGQQTVLRPIPAWVQVSFPTHSTERLRSPLCKWNEIEINMNPKPSFELTDNEALYSSGGSSLDPSVGDSHSVRSQSKIYYISSNLDFNQLVFEFIQNRSRSE